MASMASAGSGGSSNGSSAGGHKPALSHENIMALFDTPQQHARSTSFGPGAAAAPALPASGMHLSGSAPALHRPHHLQQHHPHQQHHSHHHQHHQQHHPSAPPAQQQHQQQQPYATSAGQGLLKIFSVGMPGGQVPMNARLAQQPAVSAQPQPGFADFANCTT
jgi:hypothetical protein